MQRNQRLARRRCTRANSNACTCSANTANTIPAGLARECQCDDFGKSGCPLAVAFFEIQDYRDGYCPDEALCQGTMFPELVYPWSR